MLLVELSPCYDVTDWSVSMSSAESVLAGKADGLGSPKREQLLEAGRAVFSELGFHSATVDQIADRAGVGKGTVYLYFRSKQELYCAIVEHDLEELYTETVQQMGKAETAFDRIRAYMRVRCEFAESRHDFLRLLAGESGTLVSGNESFKHLIGVAYPERSRALLENVLRDAISRGEMRELQVDAAARLLYDLSFGMVRRRLTTEPNLNMEDELNIILDVLRNGMAANR
jgi:AcrR family transcriptional regulator